MTVTVQFKEQSCLISKEILNYEIEYEIDDFFPDLAKIILDEEEFEMLCDYICDDIDVISYPRRVAKSKNN